MMFGRPIAITGGVFQIRAIGARVTVVVENGEALLIDAGLRGSSGTILQGLETLKNKSAFFSRMSITQGLIPS